MEPQDNGPSLAETLPPTPPDGGSLPRRFNTRAARPVPETHDRHAAFRLRQRLKRQEASRRLEAAIRKRDAARAKAVHWLARYNALAPSAERLVEADRLIAEAAQNELVRRLNEDATKFTDASLIRLKESSITTVARKEQWDKANTFDPKEALSEMAKRLSQLDGKFKLEVSFKAEVAVEQPQPETIDVTPTQPQLEA